jgi:hypothetical protein
MAEERSVEEALRRLSVLEGMPIRTPHDLVDWFRLRKWVLSDERLLQQYRGQPYFSCAREITKIQHAPKKSSSLFSRFLTLLRIEI